MRQLTTFVPKYGFHANTLNIAPSGSTIKATFSSCIETVGKWDTSTYEYVIPIGGPWTFSSTIGFNSLTASSRIATYLYVNGLNAKMLATLFPIGDGSADIHINGGTNLFLNRDDRVSLWVYNSSSSGTRNYAGESWFIGRYAGKITKDMR